MSDSITIPAYQINYKRLFRHIGYFCLFWLAVLAISIIVIMRNNMSTNLSVGIFISILILDIVGLILFVRQQLTASEHPVNCLIDDEGITLTPKEEEILEEKLFIPYMNIKNIKSLATPSELVGKYMIIKLLESVEEIFIYAEEMDAADFETAEKRIQEKIAVNQKK
ncbi:MAG: hypothetical protein WCI97_00990 [Bacteroidota bacterium]